MTTDLRVAPSATPIRDHLNKRWVRGLWLTALQKADASGDDAPTEPKVSGCGRVLSLERDGVGQTVAGIAFEVEPGGTVSTPGRATCSNRFLCDFCTPRSNAELRARSKHHSDPWLANGHQILHVTLTMSHTVNDRLGPMIDDLHDTRQRWMRGKAFKSLNAVHHSWTLEVDYSPVHGWAPHIHMLIYIRDSNALEPEERDVMRETLSTDWKAKLSIRDRISSIMAGLQMTFGGARTAIYPWEDDDGEFTDEDGSQYNPQRWKDWDWQDTNAQRQIVHKGEGGPWAEDAGVMFDDPGLTPVEEPVSLSLLQVGAIAAAGDRRARTLWMEAVAALRNEYKSKWDKKWTTEWTRYDVAAADQEAAARADADAKAAADVAAGNHPQTGVVFIIETALAHHAIHHANGDLLSESRLMVERLVQASGALKPKTVEMAVRRTAMLFAAHLGVEVQIRPPEDGGPVWLVLPPDAREKLAAGNRRPASRDPVPTSNGASK